MRAALNSACRMAHRMSVESEAAQAGQEKREDQGGK